MKKTQETKVLSLVQSDLCKTFANELNVKQVENCIDGETKQASIVKRASKEYFELQVKLGKALEKSSAYFDSHFKQVLK